MKKQLLWGLVLCCVCCWLSSAGAAETMRVTFINPGISDPNNPTGGFWLSVSAFMQAAAEDLNIDLEIIYAERNHILMKQQASEVARRAHPPDYLIVVNEKLAAGEMIEIAAQAGIKTFMINNIFVGEQAKQYGAPREKFPHWLGSLIPDNRYAGYQIGKMIIARAPGRCQGRGWAASDGRDCRRPCHSGVSRACRRTCQGACGISCGRSETSLLCGVESSKCVPNHARIFAALS